jgi:hypothetical protein
MAARRALTLLKKEFKGHVTLLKAFDDDEPSASARHTKTAMSRF